MCLFMKPQFAEHHDHIKIRQSLYLNMYDDDWHK